MDAPLNQTGAFVQGNRSRSRTARRSRPAFTILEVALTLIIVGVGVLAMIESQTTLIRKNEFSSLSATGGYLCTELRERLRTLPKHDPVTGLRTENADGTGALIGWGPERFNRPSPDGSGTVAAGEMDPSAYNDLDDYDGATFGVGQTFAGPIDASGTVIREVQPDGTFAAGANGAAVSLRGWSQRVTVRKANPSDFSVLLPNNEGPGQRTAGVPALRVDQYPLRITIEALYRSPNDLEARVMASLIFVAP
jgi:hypothetical protein